MSDKLYFPILLGTRREGRSSEKVAQFLVEHASKNLEIEVELFDVRDMVFDAKKEGQQLKELNPKWHKAILRADGLIIVTPEYNHGYPGSLKMTLDMMLREYVHLPVAISGVSAGSWGGTRVIESLTTVVRELGMQVTMTDLNVPNVRQLFDEEGKLVDERFSERVDGFLAELIWMAKALKWGRENVPSKYHK